MNSKNGNQKWNMHEIKTSAPTKKLHTKRQNLHRGLYAFQKR